jgi:hypothetical protein
MLNKVLQPAYTMLVSSLAVVAYRENLVAWKVLLILGRDVVARCKDNVGWDSLSSSVNSLNNCSLFTVARLDSLRLGSPL